MRTFVVLFAAIVILGSGVLLALLLVEETPPPILDTPPGPSAPEPGATGPAPIEPRPEDAPPAAPPRPESPSIEPVEPSGPPVDPTLPRVVSAFRDIPVADARVDLRTAGGTDEQYSTDRHGQFAAGDRRVLAEAIRIDAPGFAPLETAIEGSLEGRRFRLEPAGVIAGRVVDTQGTPQPWAKIQAGVVIADATGATVGLPWPEATGVSTDQQGEFRLERLDPRGRYLVAALLTRLGVDVVTGVEPVAQAAGPMVTLRLGGDASIHAEVVDPTGNPVFGPRAALSGRPDGLPGAVVADATSQAVADIMRALQIRLTRNTYSVAIPGSGGKSGFLFERLPAGEYVLEIDARGYRPYSARVRVGKHDAVRHVARLELEDIALKGLVTDAGGRAVMGANVSVHTDGSLHDGYMSAATRPDGSFAIRGPKEWLIPLNLHVSADGFETAMVPVPPGRTSVTVKLHRTGTLRGEVSLEGKETGEVVFDFVRSFPQAAQERRIAAVRHLWKRFSFTLPHGRWTMRVTAAGYEPHVGEVTIIEGGEAGDINITLRRK
jgi:hypothetical protein